MVKTDDYIVIQQDGSAITTTAAFIGKMTATTKGGGGGAGGAAIAAGQLGGEAGGGALLMEVDACAMRRAEWSSPSRSKSVNLNCSADFDESDESGGDHSGGGHNNGRHHRMLLDRKNDDRAKFTPSIESELDDRRMRRQIANCNERRRMQSINAGFQALRQLLPRKDGDKMSKAAILAATAEFIQSLLREKEKLLEENLAAMSKKRRLDIDDKKEVMLEEMPPSVLDCLRTIGDLHNSLQKETQLRMAYEKELLELRSNKQMSTVLSSPPSNDFSPNSSSSSSAFFAPSETSKRGGGGGAGLLIELARQTQESAAGGGGGAHQQLYHPTPIIPSDVQILSSAIASLAKASPGGTHQHLLNGNGTTPIGISHQQNSSNTQALFVSTNSPRGDQRAMGNTGLLLGGSRHLQFGTGRSPIQEQNSNESFGMENGGTTGADVAQYATVSQRNLQALMLAIRHLEGASNPGGEGPSTAAASSAATSANNLLVQ